MGFFSKVWKGIRGPLGAIWKGTGKAISAIPVVGEIVGAPIEALGEKMVADDAARKAFDKAQLQLTQEQQFNADQAQLNREFQRDERHAAQEWNTEMWNLNNEYNSPAEQLKRAQAAGINPNALFANGVDGAGSASAVQTSPMSGTPTAGTPSIANAILTHDALLQQMMAQTELINAQADSQKYDLTWNKLTEDERYRNLVAQSDKIFSDIGMNDFNKEQQKALLRFTAAKTDAEIKVMSEQLNLLRNQSLDLLKGIEVKDSQIRLNNASRRLTDSQTFKTNVESLQVQQQTAYISEQTEYQKMENQIKDLEVQVSEITGAPVGTDEHTMMFYLFKNGQYTDFFNYASQGALANSHAFAETAGNAFGIRSKAISLIKGNRYFYTSEPATHVRNPRYSKSSNY